MFAKVKIFFENTYLSANLSRVNVRKNYDKRMKDYSFIPLLGSLIKFIAKRYEISKKSYIFAET